MPVGLELGQGCLRLVDRVEFGPHLGADGRRVADAHEDHELLRFAGFQREIDLERAAGIVAVGRGSRAAAGFHDKRIRIGAVRAAQEHGAVGVEPGDVGPGNREERLEFPGLPATFQREPVEQRHVHDPVLAAALPGMLAELEIEQVLERIPLVGPFHVGEHGKGSRGVARVRELENPGFEGTADGHEVGGFGLNVRVLGFDDRVGRAVAACGAVLVKRLADRLPGGGPVVAGDVITDVEIAAGLVEGDGIEAQARESSVRGGSEEAVSARVIGDDGPVLGGAEIVGPRPRRVGAVDDIFLVFVVEMTVLHDGLLHRVWRESVACRVASGKWQVAAGTRRDEGKDEGKKNTAPLSLP